MYNNRPETDEIEIDLLKLAQVLLRKLKFIIAITLLAAIATFAVTFYFITPQYTATAMLYVNNSSFSLGNTSFSISQGELSAARAWWIRMWSSSRAGRLWSRSSSWMTWNTTMNSWTR